MTSLTFEESLLSRLQAAGAVVQVLDPKGEVVGYFVPKKGARGDERMQPRVSDDEIERRVREGGGRSLDEIKRDWMH
jgi:hypothetical protein